MSACILMFKIVLAHKEINLIFCGRLLKANLFYGGLRIQ